MSMELQSAVEKPLTAIAPQSNGALTDEIEDITNNDRFEITLSVSTQTVHTKAEGGKITAFETLTIDTTDDKLLKTILTTRNYSTNVWNGSCANDNYIGMTGIAMDFDGTMTIEEAQDAFTDYNYVLHTSSSHRVMKDGVATDRFRVILPFVPDGIRFTTQDECRRIYRKMLDLYPQADPACKDPGRKYFPCTSENSAPFVLHVNATSKYFEVDISDVSDDDAESTAKPYKWDGKLRPKSGLQKVLAHCPFVKWMSEKIGDSSIHIREPLKYALISNLARFEGGRDAIHDILRRDWRKHKYDETTVDAKIANALRNGGPQKYTTIRDLGWAGEIPEWPASPAGWACHVDMDGILARLKSLKGKDRMDALRAHLVEDFQVLTYERQIAWLTRISQELQITTELLGRMALEALREADLNGRDLKDVLEGAEGLRASPEDCGRIIYRWFTQNGGSVYRDREHRGYWIWEGNVFEIGSNQPFYTFIWGLAGITHEGIENRKIWAVLKAETDIQGTFLNAFTWLHTDVNNNHIYIHLNLENEQILRITEKGVDFVDNGGNEDNVLLAPAAKMLPITLLPLTASGYQQAWRDFDTLVLRNMACTRDNQLLYGSWALTYPLIDYVMTLPNMRCDGISESGKTRSTNLISFFVYGADHLKKATEAANYTDGASNPMVMLDNVEKENFNQGLGDFLLMAATGITKEKRQLNTDRGTVQERVHCLVTTNGVENLGKTEHINRTFAIHFDRWKYKSVGWSERIYPKIAAERPRLVSAHMLLISKVLRRIAKGGLEQWQDFLESKHSGHAKNRSNSFIALMALILEELLAVIDPAAKPEVIISRWVESQNRSGRKTVSESNPIITFLEAILEDCNGISSSLSEDFQHWGYEVKVEGKTIQGTAAQLHRTFSAVAKRKGMKYDFKDPRQLALRIGDTAQALKVSEDNGVVTTKKFILSTSKDRTKTTIYKFDFDVPDDTDPDDDEVQVGEPDTCTLPAGLPAPVSDSVTSTYDTDAGMQEEEEENVY